MTARTAVDPLLGLLKDMRAMIERLNDADYVAPAPGRCSGGIGAHVRHCLDHVGALVAGARTGACAYDRRARGTDVETSTQAAMARIGDLERELIGLRSAALDAPLDVETQVDTEGSMLLTTSTLGREILFVTSHTIHHNAIVSTLLASSGVIMGVRFGLAPATPTPERPLSCAP